MDVEIVEDVSAEVIRAGSTTAPAHTLYEIVRKLPDGAQVELDCGSDGSTLTLRSGPVPVQARVPASRRLSADA
jgi:DNA polymerase-3 subunit beta